MHPSPTPLRVKFGIRDCTCCVLYLAIFRCDSMYIVALIRQTTILPNLQFWGLFYQPPIPDLGQIWLKGVDLWYILLCQILPWLVTIVAAWPLQVKNHKFDQFCSNYWGHVPISYRATGYLELRHRPRYVWTVRCFGHAKLHITHFLVCFACINICVMMWCSFL